MNTLASLYTIISKTLLWFHWEHQGPIFNYNFWYNDL